MASSINLPSPAAKPQTAACRAPRRNRQEQNQKGKEAHSDEYQPEARWLHSLAPTRDDPQVGTSLSDQGEE
jgi:hypothetical protein